MKTKNKAGSVPLNYLFLAIPIFVLFSLRGPMISDLVDRSESAMVKAQLSNLKTALVSYREDFNHFPFSGNDPDLASAYAAAWRLLMTTESRKNILKQARVSTSQANWAHLGLPDRTYLSKWRGPYLDLSSVEMIDRWGNPIAYYCLDDGKFLQIFLHSAGIDGEFDLAHPDLADFAREIEVFQSFSWQRVLRIFPRQALNAHSRDYSGDDLLLAVARIRKTHTVTLINAKS